MNVPDRIFAVGGAGKAIALELLESEWIQAAILEPRPVPVSLTVTILDTAQGEENEDRERIRAVRQEIRDRKDALREDADGRVGEIDIQYKMVTNEIQLNGQIDLLGEDTVPRIAAGNGMDESNWWLRPQHINENLDFAKGVVRKRGLGKAIYYKAYAEDDSLSTFVDLPDKGKVAVIAGLGGGTGSGTFIDLVQHLKRTERTAEITLFGILPNNTEGIEENTNAFAALSELEYLSLTGENVFKDRVLLPIDPTGFDGKTGNRIQTGRFLEELDQAAVYMIASYYNTQNLEDPFANAPDYAPFTVAVPQILRYNVEAINEARETLKDILNTKQDSLEAEERLYSEIDRFLTRMYSTTNEDGGLRDLDETDLEERLDTVEELTRFDLFEELNYTSLETYGDIIEQARGEGDSIGDVIEIVSSSVRANPTRNGETFVDDIDELLADIFEKTLTLLSHRKELLERKSAIETGPLSDTVEYLLAVGDDNVNPGVRLSRLENKSTEAENRREQLESDIEDVESELESKRDEQSDEVERRTTEWRRRIEPKFEEFERAKDIDVRSRTTTLEGELEQFCSAVIDADDAEALDQVSERSVNDAISALAADLDDVGVSFEDEKQEIKNATSSIKQAKRAFLGINQEEGRIESLLPGKSSTEEERENAQRDYRMQKNKLDNGDVFSIGQPGTSFTAESTFDGGRVQSEVERTRERIETEIEESVRDAIEGSGDEYVKRLRDELNRGSPRLGTLEDIVREAVRDDLGGVEEIRSRYAELEAELDSIENRVETFEAAVDLFESLSTVRSTYVERETAFNRRRGEYNEGDDRNVSTEEEDYVYVKNIRPNDVLRTTGDDSLADSDLFKGETESQRLQSNLEELARNARNQKYTGLKRRKFSRGRARYDDLKVRVSVLSQAIDQIDNDAYDLEDVFSGAYDLGASGKRVESPYTAWDRDIGGPWDISVTAFISGVFLDNIRKVVDADGYYAGYRTSESRMGDDITVHHSLGLDEGWYVRRNDVLNMEHPDDVDFFLRDDQAVVRDLLDDYVERVETPRQAIHMTDGGE